MLEVEKYKVQANEQIRSAIKQLDGGGIGLCVCIDEKDKVIGVFSDGDFRRGVLSGVNISESITQIINRDFIYVKHDYSHDEIDSIFSSTVAQNIPVLQNGKLIEIIRQEEFYNWKPSLPEANIDNTVVIMAGGKGTRMDPFTRILPKPLIPIGKKAVIEIIMDGFARYGMNSFFISINHRGRMIKAFFGDQPGDHNIKYIDEKKPLGTAGALKYLSGMVAEPIFVSNCDIIVNENYANILEFHASGDYMMTIVASMQHQVIPYGVCELEPTGTLKKIVEKPEYDYLVNTGMYVINPEALKQIPSNKYYDMTDLINDLKLNGDKIGIYPISENKWTDIGEWNMLEKSLDSLTQIFS
jgi:dTDP-glucose pyrophosphorylase